MNEAVNTRPMLISIVIATYNAGKYIEDCLSSIATQSCKEIEVVIVDGISKDNTVEIINNFKGCCISFSSEADEGIFDAMNKGAVKARGKWIYFMGADDRLLPGFSELANKLFDESAVYYGNTEEYYDGYIPDYIILKGKFSNYRLAKYCINHQAIIYPAKVFIKYSYELKYAVIADYALSLQVWGDASFKKLYFPVTIAQYNMSGNSSNKTDTLFKRDKSSIIKKSMGTWVYLRYRFKKFKKRLRGEYDID